MTDNSSGMWRPILIAAALTLMVTVVRLVGELNGWHEMLFSNVTPGEDPAQLGLVGIVWLIPIVGFWFGLRLRRGTGEPKHAGKAALRFLTGAAVMVGGFVILSETGLMTMPDPEAPAEPTGLGYVLAIVAFSLLVLFTAWWRLTVALFVYALLARIPVVIVTWLALQNDWQTHHVKLPAGMLVPAQASQLQFLAMPQVTFWVVFTLAVGGLFGCLGAAVARRSTR